jgi:hypothetical protein
MEIVGWENSMELLTTPSFEVVNSTSLPLKVILEREAGTPPRTSTDVVELRSPVRAKVVPSTLAVRTR